MKLPPEDHVYGLETKKDPEGVGISKFIKFYYKCNNNKLLLK